MQHKQSSSCRCRGSCRPSGTHQSAARAASSNRTELLLHGYAIRCQEILSINSTRFTLHTFFSISLDERMGVFFSSNLMKRVQAYPNIDPPILSIQIRHGRTSCTTSIRTMLPSTPLDLHFVRLEIRHYDSPALTIDSI